MSSSSDFAALVCLAALLATTLPVCSGQNGRIQRQVCSAAGFALNCSSLGRSYEAATLRLLSITVYSTPYDALAASYLRNADSREIAPISNSSGGVSLLRGNAPTASFCKLRNCSRSATAATELADQPAYAYLLQWLIGQCQGRTSCSGTLPPADRLRAINVQCSSTISSYFTSALLDFGCVQDVNPTAAMPPPTAAEPDVLQQRVAEEELNGVIPIASGALTNDEKIVVAATICSSVAFAFSLLIILTCCDKIRRDRKKLFWQLKVGLPAAKSSGLFDDEYTRYGTPEAWSDAVTDISIIDEYTGVKPREVFTIDRRTMDRPDVRLPETSAAMHSSRAPWPGLSSFGSVTDVNGMTCQCSTLPVRTTKCFRSPSGMIPSSAQLENSDSQMDSEAEVASTAC